MVKLTVNFNAGAFNGWCSSRAAALRIWGQGPIQGTNAMLAACEEYHAGLFASRGAGAMGRASGYGPWEALKLSTLKARVYRRRCSSIAPFDYSGPVASDLTLQWSQRLYLSLASKGSAYGDSIRQAGTTRMKFGTTCPTGLFHAAGRSGRNPMPVRMPLDDVVAPLVAIEAAHAKIMSFLMSDSEGSAPFSSPGFAPNAAGFYSRVA